MGPLPCAEAAGPLTFSAALQNVEFPAVEIRNYHLCGFILALYEKKQVARFKCVFVVYTSCPGIQKQKMAVYHSQVNSLTFWGLWCVLKVIFCSVWVFWFWFFLRLSS